MTHLQHFEICGIFLLCGGLTFVAFFNFAAFLILCKLLWQNLRRYLWHFGVCGKIHAEKTRSN